jgi:peptide-methionine (S)-S-oxide reductase
MKKTYHIFLVFTLFICLSACAQNKTNSKNNKINMTHTETITLGSGCFWCTEAIFQRLQGVVKVTSGYSGGFVDNPTYEQVCDKNTGHAEVCQIVYDTTLIKLDDILAVFWKTHDPTTLNQQGNDLGPQYRSVVFFHNEHQKEVAEKYKQELTNANPPYTKKQILDTLQDEAVYIKLQLDQGVMPTSEMISNFLKIAKNALFQQKPDPQLELTSESVDMLDRIINLSSIKKG